MTDEELITRLLDWEEYDEGDINDAREAAANRIKELKAEIAGGSFYQEKDIDALQNRIEAQAAEIERLAKDKRWIIDERDRTFALMLSKAEKAEAEIERLRGDLKKAQGALHQIAGKKDYADDPWDIARATLAELTGGKDE